jgi:hypothetical protein
LCAAALVLLAPSVAAQEAAAARWAFDVQAYHYFVPDEPDFLLPIGMADRGALHLEGRYNYEDRDTFSAFIGASWTRGILTLTPMFGAAVGRTDGVVPGLEVSVESGRFEFWLEAEYLVNLASRDDDFFYQWSEASYRVVRWGALGVMSQRTKSFRRNADVDWGLLARLGSGRVSFLSYLIDPGRDRFLMLGVEAEF